MLRSIEQQPQNDYVIHNSVKYNLIPGDVQNEKNAIPDRPYRRNPPRPPGPKLRLSRRSSQRGKEVYTLPFTAGGPESPTPKDAFPESAEFKILSTKGEWRKDTLVLLEKITYQGGPGTIMVICSLSPDGKQLTKLSHISLDLGEFDTKAVFDKQ
jgi:hypothetical protein